MRKRTTMKRKQRILTPKKKVIRQSSKIEDKNDTLEEGTRGEAIKNIDKKNERVKSSVFAELFKKYAIVETKEVYETFNRFKSTHLDALPFFNDHMLEVYQMAFFYKFYKLKVSKLKFCGKIKPTVFNNALNEIKIENTPAEEPDGLICNLYSILHPYKRPSTD